MKRSLMIVFAFAISSGLLATAVATIERYHSGQYHEALAGQICTAVSPRAQVGAIRDAFDQAYSITKISSRTGKSYVSLKDGAAEYGQRPLAETLYQTASCGVEGRPDLALTFFFERAPIFGRLWVLAFLAISLISILGAFTLHVFSLRLVKLVQISLSDEMSRIFENGKSGKTSSNNKLKKILETLLENTPAIRKLKSELREKSRLSLENTSFRSKVSHLLKSNSNYQAQEKDTAEVVGQVRHDLRSPLSFLKVFGQTLNEKNDATETYHLSVQKIDRILKDLDQVAGAEIRSSESGAICLVECAIQETITAKKLLWRPEVETIFDLDRHKLNLSPIDEARFSRILDNLLQNSYEAIKGRGQICVAVKSFGAEIEIKISDTGIGIAEEMVRRLGSERLTFGKVNGNGVGLVTARQWIETWGGSLTIESNAGEGTSISIRIPRKETAARFVAEISLGKEQEIVVVDDEANVADQLIKRSGGNGKRFESIASYASWIDGVDLSNEKLLSVYDLHLNPGFGLDLLRLHPWPHLTALYTSDYLNPDAVELSAELGFPILPKVFLAT